MTKRKQNSDIDMSLMRGADGHIGCIAEWLDHSFRSSASDFRTSATVMSSMVDACPVRMSSIFWVSPRK